MAGSACFLRVCYGAIFSLVAIRLLTSGASCIPHCDCDAHARTTTFPSRVLARPRRPMGTPRSQGRAVAKSDR